ncbi:MAG: hypothetical protein E7480_01175 [Ruminococcaceae bacterium]|nr:hypothetical protein [Oscillospiraceae bacterium]
MNRFIEKVYSLFNTNKFLYAISVLCAIIVWLYVSGVENPDTTKTFSDIPLDVEITGTEAETNGLMLLKGAPKTVSVVLSGSRSDLATYSRSNIKASVDFNSVTKSGTFTMPVTIDLTTEKIKVSSVSPSNLELTFAVKKTASVDVKVIVNGKVSENYIADTPRAYPSAISVTGPENIIDTIASANVNVDIGGAKETVVRKNEFTLVDKDGNEIDTTNITTDVEVVSVTCPVLLSKSVPLSVSIINSSGGYDSKFAIIETEPQNIIIGAAEDILSAINSIELGVIDMAEILTTDGIQKEFDLSLPNGAKAFDAPSKVTVKVSYPELVTKTFTVKKFSVINSPSGKTITPVTSSIKVTVRGLAADITALTDDDITAVIDMTDSTSSGNIQKAVTFEFSNEANVSVQGKYTALVRVK